MKETLWEEDWNSNFLKFEFRFLEIISSKHLFFSSLRHQSEGRKTQYFLKYLEISHIIEIQNLNELNVDLPKLQQSSSVALWRKVDFSSFNGSHQDSAKICHHSFLSCISWYIPEFLNSKKLDFTSRNRPSKILNFFEINVIWS